MLPKIIPKTISMLALIALSTTACTIGSRQPEMKTEFVSRITYTGLKQFEVRLKPVVTPRDDEARRVPAGLVEHRDGPRRRGGINRRRDRKKIEKTLRKHADAVIAANHFCREGYWVLDVETRPERQLLRGECNEAATEADKERYPDTMEQWW